MTFVCLFVCLSVYDISKTAAARITKLDTEMFHHAKAFILGVKGSKVKVTRYRKQCRRGDLHPCECRLLLVHYAINPDNRYCYAELAVSSLAAAETIISTNCACTRRDGQAVLAWVGILNTKPAKRSCVSVLTGLDV